MSWQIGRLMFTSWEALESAAAWELLERQTEEELDRAGCDLCWMRLSQCVCQPSTEKLAVRRVWTDAGRAAAPAQMNGPAGEVRVRHDVWDLLEQRADAELAGEPNTRRMFNRKCRCHGTPHACATNCSPELCGCPGWPPRFPVTDPQLDAPDGARIGGYERHGDEWVRLPPTQLGGKLRQLGLFGGSSSPEGGVASGTDDFNGPCVVCGEPGRRRNTMPAAVAAVMPPLEPTCEGHELVCEWAAPLTAQQAEQLGFGPVPGVPTFRYRTVRGSKAEAAAKPPKAKPIKKPKKLRDALCP